MLTNAYYGSKFLRCYLPYSYPCASRIYNQQIKALTLFWLGFFMYIKWLGGLHLLSKIFKKDDTKLRFIW